MADLMRTVAGEARRHLGAELRATRVNAGRSTRQVDRFSTGHVSRVDNGHVLPSRAFIATYVAMGGSPGRLFSLWDRARQVADRRQLMPPTGSTEDHRDLVEGLNDPHADPYLLRRGYTVESIEDTYIVGAVREPARNEHRVIIRATMAGAQYFPFRHAYEEDPRPGVSVVTPGPGCTLPVVEEGPSGTIYAVLAFDSSTTDATGANDLSWTITMMSAVPVRPQVIGGASAPIPHVITRVWFTPPALPSSVWWFRDFDTNAGTMRPTPDRVLAPDKDHCYSCELHDLDREWWGLAWTWP